MGWAVGARGGCGDGRLEELDPMDGATLHGR